MSKKVFFGKFFKVGEVQPSHLERVLQPHQERKADRLEDPLLVQCVLYLLELDHLQVREGDKEREREKRETDISTSTTTIKSILHHFRKIFMRIHRDERNSGLINIYISIFYLLPTKHLFCIIFHAI